jgi:hypothetical protein
MSTPFSGIVKWLSELTEQTTAADTDVMPIGATSPRKITIANLKEALGINTLNRNLANRLDWTLIETNIPATATTQFPADKKEIYVGIIYGANNNVYVLSKILCAGFDFSSGSYTFHLIGGKQSGTNSAGGYIAIKTGSVYIDSVFHNEVNIKSSSKYFVAYR